jgi:hypothetical protein
LMVSSSEDVTAFLRLVVLLRQIVVDSRSV